MEIADKSLNVTCITPFTQKHPEEMASKPPKVIEDWKNIVSVINTSDCLPFYNVKSPIEVLDMDMLEVINELQDNSSVAFAHSISGDFGNQRQMSAGVAVVFRNKFGRPDRSDCLNDFLALQSLEGQAAVYSLVTKPKYSSKPSAQNYDNAFHQLITDFKDRCFQKLVCSPMGCVNDRISPQQFAKNIVQFHCKTGATVSVIVCKKQATRMLRKGVKHHEFVALLRSTISKELTLNDSLPQPSLANNLYAEKNLSFPSPTFKSMSIESSPTTHNDTGAYTSPCGDASFCSDAVSQVSHIDQGSNNDNQDCSEKFRVKCVS